MSERSFDNENHKNLIIMKIYNKISPDQWPSILKRPVIESNNLETAVRSIMDQVQNQGDEALIELTNTFDKVQLENLKVSPAEIEAAIEAVDPKLKKAIEIAKINIERFHFSQKEIPQVVETMPGVQCWRKSVAIEKVGLYIPGGTAPLFSTVLMLGVPARIAGCSDVILCTPPQKDGSVNPAILFAAQSVGISKIFSVGGAQAIAAMAFGTESIPAVNKIFGPGNQYVTEAKQQANRVGVAMDLPAGPSEVMVVADQSANPQFVASDLLSQAEHGTDSQVVLIVFQEELVNEIIQAMQDQLAVLPRKAMAQSALENSLALIAKNKREVIDMINVYAPEHLILAIENAEWVAANVKNAGSVFLGNYSPESAGDYASGTNHTLPTNGFAKAYSGVSLDSFVKKITFQKITDKGLQNLGPVVEVMAEAEQLQAHKNAVSIRLDAISKEKLANSKEKGDTKPEPQALSITSLVRSDLRSFEPYSSARDEFKGEANVFLDANENPFDTNLNRYPDPLQKALKSGIANLKGVTPANIFLGNGSDEAIDLLIRLFCETGTDSILTLAPTYGVYSVCAKTAGIQIKTLLLDENFQPDLNALSSLGARQSKILFLCNPNNPTGSIISIEVLKNIIQNFPGIVVVDEAYIDFSEEPSCLSLIEECPNLVVLQTFSKAWGLAGARLGMAFSNPELINWLNKIKLPYNINQLTQQIVLDKIKNREQVQQEIETIKSERSKVMRALKDFDFVKKVFPSQTNFIFVKVNQARQLYNFLMEKGIIIRDRSNQLNCENGLRITIGTAKENDLLLKSLAEYSKIKSSNLLSISNSPNTITKSLDVL